MPTAKKTKPKIAASKCENKPSLVAFLLDRSGSMASCLNQTIQGFNGYIKELRNSEKNGQMRFTLVQFDTEAIDVLHDMDPVKKVQDLTTTNYHPRGGTPLYDAMGKIIRETETKAGDKYKVLFVTLTDGQENCSCEWNHTAIKNLIKEKEDQNHWTFAYIGVGIDGFSAAQHLTVGTTGASNILRTSNKNTVRAYARFAGQTMAYACCSMNAAQSSADFWDGKTSTEDEVQS